MHARLIFPHQLFRKLPELPPGSMVILVEEFLFFRQFPFHKAKLVFHRASMQLLAAELRCAGVKVGYIDTAQPESDIRLLMPRLPAWGITSIEIIEVADDWLRRRIIKFLPAEVTLHWLPSPAFLLSEAEWLGKLENRKVIQTEFYIAQRKRFGVLLDPTGKPEGNKWTFDRENRKRFPKGDVAPPLPPRLQSEVWQRAAEEIQQQFPNNPGASEFELPLTPEQARQWLDDFIVHRFADFGIYEDAMVSQEMLLHHSLLSPLLNVGLLLPGEVLAKADAAYRTGSIPLNSTEGFIRQILGWREFIRGRYEQVGRAQRTRNFWNFSRRIPESFYSGQTGIVPVDIVVAKILATGYAHHIERLMVLGNFMMLCEFHPDEVYRWFMMHFIDAYDWVMVPNIYAMSQYADGGAMTTKPYISGSNYLRKMGDFPSGPWEEIWDALFWRFLHVHRDNLKRNVRLAMLITTFDRMPPAKQTHLLSIANNYLSELTVGHTGEVG